MSAAGEKPFEATPARRARARRDGNVARSAEASSVAAFAAAIVAAMLAVPLGAGAAASAVRVTAQRAHAVEAPAFALLVVAALLPAAAAATAGCAVTLAQSGGLHAIALRLDPARLQPVGGLKRMFGGEAVVAALRGTLAFGVALIAVAPVVGDAVSSGATLTSPLAAAALAGPAALRACWAAAAVGAAFALADYALARRRWLRSLRMSLEELRRDAKEHDGNPQARSRRKSAHRALVRGSLERLREASFVVVNPTHVAVAMRYAPPAVPVPEVLVRALDDAALRVKSIARERRIPVVEDAALARLLYAQGESGRPIPPEAYVAVAQIVAALAREGVL
jgi:flagellar biosynthesis protein FlhB